MNVGTNECWTALRAEDEVSGLTSPDFVGGVLNFRLKLA